MWFGLINEIKFWFIRTFKTRKCYIPEEGMMFSWSDDEIPDWVKNTDKSVFDFQLEDTLSKEEE